MRLTPTDEQASLAEAVRDWGADRHGIAASREHPHHPQDTRGSLAGAGELGLFGILDPEEGGTQRDLSIVVEQLGACAVDAPVGASTAAVALASSLGLTGVDLAAAADGSTVLLAAVAEPDTPPPMATLAGDGSATLQGVISLVPGAEVADAFLIVAATDAGEPVLAVVPADAVTITARVTLDVSRGFASVGLQSVAVPAGSVATGAAAAEAAALLFDVLALHAVADAVGAASSLAARTYTYVVEREQFGQPIAKFQAVKHHCATMAMDVDAAQSILAEAGQALDGTDVDERARLVSVAASFAGEACSRVAGTALQLHGGMGFTWEHDLHVLLRRIKTDELTAGTPRWHRRRLAALLS